MDKREFSEIRRCLEKTQKQIENEEKRKGWEKQIAKWAESGTTQTEYCRIHGLNAGQFTYRKSRLKKMDDAPGHLVPVQINPVMFQAEPESTSPLRLNIGNGLQIEIENNFDPSLLTALIQTVRAL